MPAMMTKKTQVKYKKAPQAPRRFKSSYMFFSTEKHKLIRKELAEKGEANKVSTTEVAKMVSQAWKALSHDEREEWEEMARRDKARFEYEKSIYAGPWKVPAKKRSQKDPNAPKRPMSAFLSFSNSKRAQVKSKHPDIGNAEVSRILAQMWKDAPEDERKEHIDNEFRLRQEYKVAIAEWRKNSECEMQAARKEREDEAMKAVLAGKQPGSSEPDYQPQQDQYYGAPSYSNHQPSHAGGSHAHGGSAYGGGAAAHGNTGGSGPAPYPSYSSAAHAVNQGAGSNPQMYYPPPQHHFPHTNGYRDHNSQQMEGTNYAQQGGYYEAGTSTPPYDMSYHGQHSYSHPHGYGQSYDGGVAGTMDGTYSNYGDMYPRDPHNQQSYGADYSNSGGSGGGGNGGGPPPPHTYSYGPYHH